MRCCGLELLSRGGGGARSLATRALVLNAGSSSLKYGLFDVDASRPGRPRATSLCSGLCERIGEPGDGGAIRHVGAGGARDTHDRVALPDHAAALGRVVELLTARGGPIARADEIGVVGHRVVHGGAALTAPRVVDDDVEAQIEACVPLAPLHNPANLLGIRTARAQFSGAPHVAVFDTAFHATMPPESYAYALPKELREERGVRKYGFHGTSYT